MYTLCITYIYIYIYIYKIKIYCMIRMCNVETKILNTHFHKQYFAT